MAGQNLVQNMHSNAGHMLEKHDSQVRTISPGLNLDQHKRWERSCDLGFELNIIRVGTITL